MSWYKKITAAPRAIRNNNMIEVVNIFDYGKDMGIQLVETLKKIGFRWNGVRGPGSAWQMPARAFNQSDMDKLQNAGIDVSSVEFGMQAPARQPARQQPSIRIAPPQQQEERPEVRTILSLAKGLENIPVGTPIAVYQIMTNPQAPFTCAAEDGKVELVQPADARHKIESVKDSSGRPVIENDAIPVGQMLKKYKDLLDPQGGPVEEKPIQEDTDVVKEEGPKGRIPSNLISSYQKDIEETFLKEENNIVINALAGTGKTTVLKHLASFKKPNEKWLYVVFNKKNQVEAKEEFPAGVQVATSHSFLFSVMKNTPRLVNLLSKPGPRQRINIDKGRTKDIIQKVVDAERKIPRDILRSYYKVAEQIVGLCKAEALNPKDNGIFESIERVIQTYQVDTSIATKYGKGPEKDFRDDLIQSVALILEESYPGMAEGDAKKGIDFDDMLWIPSLYGDQMNWPTNFNVVLVDEVQDFNECQIAMVEQMTKTGAKVVAVGDPNQSIYRFRGGVNSFEKVQNLLAEQEKGVEVRSLPVNYRCAKSVVDWVNNDQGIPVDNLQYPDTAIDGEVVENLPYHEVFDGIYKSWKENNGKTDMQTAIIGRMNKPLVEAAMDFISRDIAFEIVGKDLGADLTKLIEQITERQYVDLPSFEVMMAEYMEQQEAKLGKKLRHKEKLTKLRDTIECLQNILSHVRVPDGQGGVTYVDKSTKRTLGDTYDFYNYIKSRFSGSDPEALKNKDPKSYITLTTAHSSKGLEFDRVIIADIDNFPIAHAQSPEELEQEANLKYVAATRAKVQLNIPEPKPRDE
jgi:superfamily I DNA/RNA helicase